jgi:hypothetical protein
MGSPATTEPARFYAYTIAASLIIAGAGWPENKRPPYIRGKKIQIQIHFYIFASVLVRDIY